MKKDIEWLKDKIRAERERLALSLSEGQETMREFILNNGKHGALVDVLELIDQLDEPEVLSQELPVIPKYVADWIEETKEKGYPLAYAINCSKGELGKWLHECDTDIETEENQELFAEAWLDGYEVEEEPLYYALVKGHELVTNEGDLTCKYWKFDTSNGGMFLSNQFSRYGRFLNEMSKEDWNELGINDSNADFVKVV